jgi:hypothetical protein
MIRHRQSARRRTGSPSGRAAGLVAIAGELLSLLPPFPLSLLCTSVLHLELLLPFRASPSGSLDGLVSHNKPILIGRPVGGPQVALVGRAVGGQGRLSHWPAWSGRSAEVDLGQGHPRPGWTQRAAVSGRGRPASRPWPFRTLLRHIPRRRVRFPRSSYSHKPSTRTKRGRRITGKVTLVTFVEKHSSPVGQKRYTLKVAPTL